MRRVLCAGWLVGLVTGMFASGPLLASVKPCYDDAALHAVQFVDKNEGWAVGDEGVIWHTIDGGKSWERQSTAVRASLRGVHFLNPFTGWVVGRMELPGGRSEGVVLFTHDGGEKWHRAMAGALPGLNGVRFVRELEGYLFGDGSDLHPSGLFRTEDGGKSWHPVAGPRTTTWRSGAFAATGEAALGGAWNRLATLKNNRVTTSEVDALGGRTVTSLHFDGKQGLAVGQGGLILQSEDMGTTWSFVDLRGLEKVRPAWDLHAVHGQGGKLWVVGRPGSALLHSPDGGKNWEVRKTGHSVPLHGVFFLDDRTGYAVGELGTILHTTDAGATWKLQHRGGQRAAVLAIHARPEHIPLDTLATLGGQEGYLAVALQVTGADSTSAAPSQALQPFRVQSSARLAGAAGGEMLWAYPVPSHLAGSPLEDTLRVWNRLHGDRANDHLLGQLVLALRMWRPNLLLVDGPGAAAGVTPVEERLLRLLDQALNLSGDASAFPEQVQVLGLEPWRVTKVYSPGTGTGPKRILLDTTEYTPNLGTTARDQAALASGSLLSEEARYPTMRTYQLVAGPADADAHRSLMQGIDLARGGLARRSLEVNSAEDPDLRKVVQQMNTLHAISENPGKELTDPNKLMGQLTTLLDRLPVDLGARTACQLGGQLARNGQWVLAREVYQTVVDRYPAHPQAIPACRWLMQYHASSEARRRDELNHFARFVRAEAGIVNGVEPVKTSKGPVEVPQVVSAVAGVEGMPANADTARRWHQGALDLEKHLASQGPLHALDPAMQMALLSVKRKMGDREAARKGYALLAARQPEGPWKSSAQAELWLMDRHGEAPRPQLESRQTEARPRLDGRLDDACWEAAKIVRLKAATGDATQYSTEVRMAHDAEFLYVAVQCKHPAGQHSGPPPVREHDRDLRAHDRVSLLLDLDRDYATAFHLQVDRRGCVWDDCWGDRGWNPRWFVARHADETSWTVELAIPLESLSATGLSHGTIWAANVIRTTPGVGVQALSLPAEAPEEVLRPEGFGLLLFHEGPKK